MNKFDKLIKQTNFQQTNNNTSRVDDTSATVNEQSFIPLDGRTLRRVNRSHQLNTKIRSELQAELYRVVIAQGITITAVVESALTAYFAKLKSEGQN